MIELQERLNKINQELMIKQSKRLNNQIPISVIETAIKIAGSAPSGANQQPWTYVLINDTSVKQKLVDRLENEALRDYTFIILLFKQNHGVKINEDGTIEIVKHYYAHDSVCLSAGMLVGAFHYANITYDLLPINKKINDILSRPNHETAILSFSIKGISDNSDEVTCKIMDFYEIIKGRRSIRRYSNHKFNEEIIRHSIKLVDNILSSQSHYFELVSDSSLKHKIRKASEENEKRLYEELISEEWKNALNPLKTNWQKSHLTEAPYLIIAFSRKHDNVSSRKQQNQQIMDSKTMTGIATGLLIQILHYIGLSTLTYTPSPMRFLNSILDIPSHLTPMMVLPIGYKDKSYQLPDIKRKELEDILIKFKR
ncbi:nitroreductase family protein [Mycoplasmatota bacterium]|nr:nitroreductase family protein [Mycoplasmatota bacterium]